MPVICTYINLTESYVHIYALLLLKDMCISIYRRSGYNVAIDKNGKTLLPRVRQRSNGKYEGRVQYEFDRYSVYQMGHQ